METINKEIDIEKARRLMEIQRQMSAIFTETQTLANGPRSVQKEKELAHSVRSLKESWFSAVDGQKHITPDTFYALENVYNSGIAITKEIFDSIKGFCDMISEAVFIELNNWLNIYIYIYIYAEQEFAAELLEFCAETPRGGISSIFLTNLILKLRFNTENKKSEFLMSMMEKNPTLLSGADMPHPEYVYKPSAQRTFEKCPICGGEGEPYHCASSYRMAHFDNPFQPFKLWMRCKSCRNLYTKRFPEEFLDLSTHQKRITPSENSETSVSKIINAIPLNIWSSILNKLRAYTDKKSLLEVGIGNGELLSVALEMNYQADAVEIVEESAQRVSDILGIPIWNGDFLNFSPDKTYPIIIMGDVIEHVTDPEAALKNVYRLLDDDGVLWLSTPNYESSFTRLKKFTDPMWMEPYHITYFNYGGLEALLDKCGFAVREYTVSNRYNGSMELIITKK